MTQQYWDKVAENYESEVLSVFDCDFEGAVCERIKRIAAAFPGGCAADLGCGVGKFSAVMGRYFKRVEACDFSQTGLDNARSLCKDLEQIRFHQVDLCRDLLPFDPVDLVLCINVLMMADLDECLRAWRSVTNQVKSGGCLVLVVPSLESVVMQRHHEVEACLDEGSSCKEALQQSLPERSSAMDLFQGVHQLDGAATRHYLKEELSEMLVAHHFNVEEIVRLNYREKGQGKTLANWDWMAVARRKQSDCGAMANE